jgi:hypothetical protein
MGCCEKTINILGCQYKISSSSSSSLIGLKETNLSSGAKNDSPISLNKVLKSLLRDKQPNIKVNFNKSNKKKIVLEKIKEEESESKESSINYKKMISKEKLIEIRNSKKLNIISNKNNSKKLENIKLLRKNRSHPKFKIKLNEQIFIKKLNEYKNNKTKGNNYINNLSYISQLKESKSEQLFVTLYDKSFDDSCFIDSINKINNEKRNKIIYRNNISSKRNNKGSYIQYYEEEYNKNQLK